MKRHYQRSPTSNAAVMERMKAAAGIVRSGKCPICGRNLKRNLSLDGWYQCEQLGAVGFRADPTMPSCEFQTFVTRAQAKMLEETT